MLAGVGAAGGLAQRAFGGGAPGVVRGDVEVALVRQGLGQVLAEHPGAHPRVVALAEHVAMAILAGGVVGVGEGAEVQDAAFPGALAGGDRHGAGRAAEQHRRAVIDQAVDVVHRLFRARGGIAADHAQRPAEYATLGIQFVDRQQGAAHLREAFFLVAAGAGVVQSEGDRIYSTGSGAKSGPQG
ncbi:hypothetical protein D3C86_1558710 [compost metagenome]